MLLSNYDIFEKTSKLKVLYSVYILPIHHDVLVIYVLNF